MIVNNNNSNSDSNSNSNGRQRVTHPSKPKSNDLS